VYRVARRVGFESTQYARISNVSSTYENCNVHIDTEYPNDLILPIRLAGQEACAAHSIEASLAAALGEAARVGQWHIVAQLAKELEARRSVAPAYRSVLLPPKKGTFQ
jgi:hypothetical protein